VLLFNNWNTQQSVKIGEDPSRMASSVRRDKGACVGSITLDLA